jgi:tape measure domain-containing protein
MNNNEDRTAADVTAGFNAMAGGFAIASNIRDQEMVAKQGYVSFQKSISANAFKKKHPDWKEVKTGNEFRFYPPNSAPTQRPPYSHQWQGKDVDKQQLDIINRRSLQLHAGKSNVDPSDTNTHARYDSLLNRLDMRGAAIEVRSGNVIERPEFEGSTLSGFTESNRQQFPKPAINENLKGFFSPIKSSFDRRKKLPLPKVLDPSRISWQTGVTQNDSNNVDRSVLRNTDSEHNQKRRRNLQERRERVQARWNERKERIKNTPSVDNDTPTPVTKVPKQRTPKKPKNDDTVHMRVKEGGGLSLAVQGVVLCGAPNKPRSVKYGYIENVTCPKCKSIYEKENAPANNLFTSSTPALENPNENVPVLNNQTPVIPPTSSNVGGSGSSGGSGGSTGGSGGSTGSSGGSGGGSRKSKKPKIIHCINDERGVRWCGQPIGADDVTEIAKATCLNCQRAYAKHASPSPRKSSSGAPEGEERMSYEEAVSYLHNSAADVTLSNKGVNPPNVANVGKNKKYAGHRGLPDALTAEASLTSFVEGDLEKITRRTYTADKTDMKKTRASALNVARDLPALKAQAAKGKVLIGNLKKEMLSADDETKRALEAVVTKKQEELELVNNEIIRLTAAEKDIKNVYKSVGTSQYQKRINQISNAKYAADPQKKMDALVKERDALQKKMRTMDVSDPAYQSVQKGVGLYNTQIKEAERQVMIKKASTDVSALHKDISYSAITQDSKLDLTQKRIKEFQDLKDTAPKGDKMIAYYTKVLQLLKEEEKQLQKNIKLDEQQARVTIKQVATQTRQETIPELMRKAKGDALKEISLLQMEIAKEQAIVDNKDSTSRMKAIAEAKVKEYKNALAKLGDQTVLREVSRLQGIASGDGKQHRLGSLEANQQAQATYLALISESAKLKDRTDLDPKQKASISHALRGLEVGAFSVMRGTSAEYLNQAKINMETAKASSLGEMKKFLMTLRQDMSVTRGQIQSMLGKPGENLLRSQLAQQRQMEREARDSIRENIYRRVSGRDKADFDVPSMGRAKANLYAENISEFAKIAGQDIQDRFGKTLGIVNGISNGLLMAAGATAMLASEAVKASAKFEATRVTMGAILKDTGAANQLVSDIMAYSLETPFQFDQLADMSRQLLAFGYTAKETMPMLKSIVDAVTAVGGDQGKLSRIIQDFGKMRSSGVINAREMLQLTQAGLPAWEILANNEEMGYGGNQKKLRDDMRNRKVDSRQAIPALIQGFQERYGGVAEERMQTTQGKMENFQERITFAFVKLGEALLPFANGLLEIGTWLLNLSNSPGLRAIATITANFLFWGGAVGGIIGKLTAIVPALAAMTKGISAGIIATAEMAGMTMTETAVMQASIATKTEAALIEQGIRNQKTLSIITNQALTATQMEAALVEAGLTAETAKETVATALNTRATIANTLAEEQSNIAKEKAILMQKRLAAANVWILALTVIVTALVLVWDKWLKQDTSAEKSQKMQKNAEETAKSFEKLNNAIGKTIRDIDNLEKAQTKNADSTALLASRYNDLRAMLRSAGAEADKLADAKTPEALIKFAREFMSLNIEKQIKALADAKMYADRSKLETSLTEYKDNPSDIGRKIVQISNRSLQPWWTRKQRMEAASNDIMDTPLFKKIVQDNMKQGLSRKEATNEAFKPFAKYMAEYESATGTYDEVLQKRALLQAEMYRQQLEAAKEMGMSAADMSSLSTAQSTLWSNAVAFAQTSADASQTKPTPYEAGAVKDEYMSTQGTKSNFQDILGKAQETNNKLKTLYDIRRQMKEGTYTPPKRFDKDTVEGQMWSNIGEGAEEGTFQKAIETEISNLETKKSNIDKALTDAANNMNAALERDVNAQVSNVQLVNIPEIVRKATTELAKQKQELVALQGQYKFDAQGNKIVDIGLDAQVKVVEAQIKNNELLINKMNEARNAKLMSVSADKAVAFFINETARETEFGTKEFDKYASVAEKIKSHMDALKNAGKGATGEIAKLREEFTKYTRLSEAFQADKNVKKVERETTAAVKAQGYMSVDNATGIYNAKIDKVQKDLLAGNITADVAREQIKVLNTARARVAEAGKLQEDIIAMWRANDDALRSYAAEDATGIHTSAVDKARAQVEAFNKILQNMAMQGKANTAEFKRIRAERDKALATVVGRTTEKEKIDLQFEENKQRMTDTEKVASAQLSVWTANQSPTNTIDDRLAKKKAQKDLELAMAEMSNNQKIMQKRKEMQKQIEDLRKGGAAEDDINRVKEAFDIWKAKEDEKLAYLRMTKERQFMVEEAYANRMKRLREQDSIDALARIFGMSAEQTKWMKRGRELGDVTPQDRQMARIFGKKPEGEGMETLFGKRLPNLMPIAQATQVQGMMSNYSFKGYQPEGYDRYNSNVDVSGVFNGKQVNNPQVSVLIKSIDSLTDAITGSVSLSLPGLPNNFGAPVTELVPTPGLPHPDSLMGQAVKMASSGQQLNSMSSVINEVISGSPTALGNKQSTIVRGLPASPLTGKSGTRGGHDIKLVLSGLGERLFKVLESIDNPGGTGRY